MLSPPHPVAQCLARAADLLGNRVDRRPLRSVLGLVVQDHPNRASTDLRGIWGNSLRHGSILSRVGASGKLGTVQIDRTSKFAFTELHAKATTRVAADFLHALVKAVPYKIHTVLTDNGTHFTNPRGETWSPAEIKQMIERKEPFLAHAFEYACSLADIDHRLTKPKHPWTNGQVERMNRTIKEATVRRFHYDTADQLRSHLADFVTAYNFARRLKILKGLSPYEYICKAWTEEPGRFILDPIQQMLGLNTGAHAEQINSRGGSDEHPSSRVDCRRLFTFRLGLC